MPFSFIQQTGGSVGLLAPPGPEGSQCWDSGGNDGNVFFQPVLWQINEEWGVRELDQPRGMGLLSLRYPVV